MSTVDESYYLASQWQLMWRKFRKHRLAVGGGTVLALCYLVGLFCVSLAPYDVGHRFPEHIYAPPVRVHFVDAEGRFRLRPFVYGLVKEIHPETWLSIYTGGYLGPLPAALLRARRPVQVLGCAAHRRPPVRGGGAGVAVPVRHR